MILIYSRSCNARAPSERVECNAFTEEKVPGGSRNGGYCHFHASHLAALSAEIGSLREVPLDGTVELPKDLVEEWNTSQDTGRLAVKSSVALRVADHVSAPVEGWAVLLEPVGHLALPAGWQQVSVEVSRAGSHFLGG